MVNLQNGGGWAFYTDTTTAVTVSGNMVSFEDNSSGGESIPIGWKACSSLTEGWKATC